MKLKELQDKMGHWVNISLCMSKITRGHCGRDRMVVGFTATCAISAYHHQS
jgi:hypothetical protein